MLDLLLELNSDVLSAIHITVLIDHCIYQNSLFHSALTLINENLDFFVVESGSGIDT